MVKIKNHSIFKFLILFFLLIHICNCKNKPSINKTLDQNPIEIHNHGKSNFDTDFVTDPDVKANYIGDPDTYEHLVNNKYGCDGIVDIVFIIEKDGSLSNISCVGARGKTNCEIGLNLFGKLNLWESAIKNGVKVRSQMKLSIHT